eukprot:TRINITY_DN12476_c0_g5_i2.p1 TRINITY_DN12476_c0_g5~~TRINITY_DN12476_c0_g5_i2.p1  ORF type:complete len:270 (-),score=51.38 TRINITY_DN12476_c0_g5_i2:196-1005(-)
MVARDGSRSPRRDPEARVEPAEHEPECDPDPQSMDGKAMLGQIRMQSAYLQQVLNPGPPPPGYAPAAAPRELSAGVPLEAARQLLLPSPGAAAEWSRLAAHEACFAVALRLFEILVPQIVPQDACAKFCSACESSIRKDDALACGRETLEEAACAWGFSARTVSTAAESLQAMAENRPVACCCFLHDYVGVSTDAETGEETEHEVGGHCVLIVGGDLAGGPLHGLARDHAVLALGLDRAHSYGPSTRGSGNLARRLRRSRCCSLDQVLA